MRTSNFIFVNYALLFTKGSVVVTVIDKIKIFITECKLIDIYPGLQFSNKWFIFIIIATRYVLQMRSYFEEFGSLLCHRTLIITLAYVEAGLHLYKIINF